VTMRERFAAVVSELVETDPRVAVVLADIGVDRFAPVAARHPERVVNLGIMEQAAIGVAAGFALEGFVPVVHSIAPFLVERPFEQIKDDFCNQRLGGLFASVGASYDYASEGMTHQAPADVALMSALPDTEILVPGTAGELETLLRASYDDGAVTYLRTSVRANAEDRDVELGRLTVVRRGAAGTVVAVGPLLDATLAATDGLDLTVLYATTVSPFDSATLAREAAGDVLVVEPYAGEVLVAAVARALDRPARIGSIGVPRRPLSRYGTPEEHERALGLDAAGIGERLRRFFGASPRPRGA
jgi:transketolase